MVVKDGDGVGGGRGDAARRAARRRRAGGARRPGRHPVRPPGGRRRAQGLPGAGRGRPARPGRGQRGAGAPDRRARRRRLPVGEVVGAVPAALEADQQALYDEALATARAADRRRGHARRGDRGGRRPAGPGCRGRRSGVEGEAKANAAGVTVRCLIRADGSVPDSRGRARPGRILGSRILVDRWRRPRVCRCRLVWQNGCLVSGVRTRPLNRRVALSIEWLTASTPRRWRVCSASIRSRSEHNVAVTNPASADGQDPQPAVPHRRCRLAHQA